MNKQYDEVFYIVLFTREMILFRATVAKTKTINLIGVMPQFKFQFPAEIYGQENSRLILEPARSRYLIALHSWC